jgi:hypothetical protein
VIAAPAIFGRIIGHAGAHRIELNVPVAGEEIPLTLYQAGMIPTLPQRSAPMVRLVDIPDIAPVKGLHDSTNAAQLGGMLLSHNCLGSENETVRIVLDTNSLAPNSLPLCRDPHDQKS